MHCPKFNAGEEHDKHWHTVEEKGTVYASGECPGWPETFPDIADMPPSVGATIRFECCGLERMTDETGWFSLDHECEGSRAGRFVLSIDTALP